MPGSTAYGGLIDVLAPNEGETIFISAASGAVGSLVGLLAKKLYNCKVIGSAGGPEKCQLLLDLGYFDHAIDYKQHATAESLTAALKDAAPNGIDMYFENVGGIHFDAAFKSLREKGRIAICGCISQYNKGADEPRGNSIDISAMIYTQQRIQGFLCGDYLRGAKLKFFEDINRMYSAGEITLPPDTVFNGIESWPEGFASLFTGAKMGKVVVKL
jgi:NADPH-dependent curcumin reductase CurA